MFLFKQFWLFCYNSKNTIQNNIKFSGFIYNRYYFPGTQILKKNIL